MEMRRSDGVWLGGIVTLALILRLIKLDAGLWYDEILTLVQFIRLPASDLVTTYTTLNNHILYSLEAKAAVALFGESAWALRLPAALFGAGSIAALWALARMVAGRWQAHFSALLMAVSYHHVWFSQNARGYTGLLFWTLIATIFFVRGVQRPDWRLWAGYGLVLAAAMYTHLSAAFTFLTHGLVYLALVGRHFWLRRRGAAAPDAYAASAGMGPVLGFALGGILTLALYAVLIPQMIDTFGAVAASPSAKATVTEWKNPLWTLLEIIRSLTSLGGLVSLGLPVVVICLVAGLLNLGRHQPVLTALFVLHIPLTLAILSALSFRIWPRYFLIDLGFIFLFLVHGVFVLADLVAGWLRSEARWGLGGTMLGGAASVIAVLASLVLLPANYRHPKQDFLGARAYIEEVRRPGDQVASIGLAAYAYSQYYAPEWTVIETKAQLDAALAGPGRLWVVTAFPTHTRTYFPELSNMLNARFERVKVFPGTLGDGEVAVYRNRSR